MTNLRDFEGRTKAVSKFGLRADLNDVAFAKQSPLLFDFGTLGRGQFGEKIRGEFMEPLSFRIVTHPRTLAARGFPVQAPTRKTRYQSNQQGVVCTRLVREKGGKWAQNRVGGRH